MPALLNTIIMRMDGELSWQKTWMISPESDIKEEAGSDRIIYI